MLADIQVQEALETVARLEAQLALAKTLNVAGDCTEEDYEKKKRQ